MIKNATAREIYDTVAIPDELPESPECVFFKGGDGVDFSEMMEAASNMAAGNHNEGAVRVLSDALNYIDCAEEMGSVSCPSCETPVEVPGGHVFGFSRVKTSYGQKVMPFFICEDCQGLVEDGDEGSVNWLETSLLEDTLFVQCRLHSKDGTA